MKNKQIMMLAAGIAFGIGVASSATALDMTRIKAHVKPAADSAEETEICAASMMGAAYLAKPGSDEATLNTTFGRAWVKLALKDTGKEMGDYADNILTPNMQALYDDGDATVKFYHDLCLVATKRMMG